MNHSVIDVTNGPGKDELLRAVTNDDGLLTTIFDTAAGAVEAQIVRIEERGDDGVDISLGPAGILFSKRRLLHSILQLPETDRAAGVERCRDDLTRSE